MKSRLFSPMHSMAALLIFMAALLSGCTNSGKQTTENAETNQEAADTTNGISANPQTTMQEDSSLTADVSGETVAQPMASKDKTPEATPGQGQAVAKPQTLQKNTTPKSGQKTTAKPAGTTKPAPAPKTNSGAQTEKPVTHEPAKTEQAPSKPAPETSAPKPENTQPPAAAPEPKKTEEVKKEPADKPASAAPAPKSGVWTAPASAKAVKNPVPSDAASLAAGKKAFEKECVSCHGKKGKGDGPNAATLEKAPASLLSDRVASQTDGEIFWKITEGKKPMSSAKKTLTEEQRWQVVNYVRQLSADAKSKGHH
ncbi:MAG: c-type cytochrome [Saprospiraceae bacterium]|nr:MAG: c-type cytochrome [Saprospiraceae bacterium]